MKTRVLAIVHSFPENIVTLSKFRLFLDNPQYDYQVFCWDAPASAWQLWASDMTEEQRAKVIVSGAKKLFSHAFLLEFLHFVYFLVTHPVISFHFVQYHRPTIGLLRSLYRLLDDYKIIEARPQILHFEFGTIALSRIYLKQFIPCKVVVSFRGFDLNFHKLDQEGVYTPVWENADGFHFLGQDLLERAVRRGFLDTKPYQLIPPAIDTRVFLPTHTITSAPETPISLVSVGRLVWKKGYNFGLLAFAEFIKKGGKGNYHLVGDGPAREELLFYAVELGIKELVVFHGKCSPQAVKVILDQSDVFLHPAISEGFCNAVMEAQAMQLPVLCFAADGLLENVSQGETGYIVPLWDWQQLAGHLYDLWLDPSRRREMGKKGRERIAQQFSLERQMTGFETLYQRVLNN
jgi:colanic acid/amylovoran biosynthesis glycosyltransferase